MIFAKTVAQHSIPSFHKSRFFHNCAQFHSRVCSTARGHLFTVSLAISSQPFYNSVACHQVLKGGLKVQEVWTAKSIFLIGPRDSLRNIIGYRESLKTKLKPPFPGIEIANHIAQNITENQSKNWICHPKFQVTSLLSW